MNVGLLFLSYKDTGHLCNTIKNNYITHGGYKCNLALTGNPILKIFESYGHTHVYNAMAGTCNPMDQKFYINLKLLSPWTYVGSCFSNSFSATYQDSRSYAFWLSCKAFPAILVMQHRYPVQKFLPPIHECTTCNLGLVRCAVSENRCLKIIVIYLYKAPGQGHWSQTVI